MRFYNFFSHCGQDFYTATHLESIECSECGEQVTSFKEVKTETPISGQDGEITYEKVQD